MKLQLYSKFSVNLFFTKVENAHQEHHGDDLICSSKY
jgi:hypothetical protein